MGAAVGTETETPFESRLEPRGGTARDPLGHLKVS
jgi:hypothetical protein